MEDNLKNEKTNNAIETNFKQQHNPAVPGNLTNTITKHILAQL
jgi:hypothetical protein